MYLCTDFDEEHNAIGNCASCGAHGVKLREHTCPDTLFKWKTRKHEMIPVDKMVTRHLFYTLRMIWNHSAPKELRLKPYRAYNFSPFYSPEYMRLAIRFMLKEIAIRPDVTPTWQAELAYMIEHASKVKALENKN